MAVKLFRIRVPKDDILELLNITEKADCLINIGYDNVLASGKGIQGLLSLDNSREWLFIMHDISSDKDYKIAELVKDRWKILK